MSGDYSGPCQVSLIHADESESPCVLPKRHLLDDSDHRDWHGCTAPVLVHQSTIRAAQALQDARDAEREATVDDDFRVNIELTGDELGDPGMQDLAVAKLLREVANRVARGDRSGTIRDTNGNTVGSFEFD